MESPINLVSFVTRAANRVDVLLTLSPEPRTRHELQNETEIPRATLSRILADFRNHELVTRDGHQYMTTPLGDLLADELTSLFESVAAMGTLQTVREWLAIDKYEVPIERLADADVIVPEPADPLAPTRRAEDLLGDGSHVRLIASGIVPGCLEAVWRGVTEGRQTFEGVMTAASLNTMAEDPEMKKQAEELFTSDNAAGFVHPEVDLPLIFVVDDLVWIAVTDDSGTIQGHIETTDETVRAWAQGTIDDYAREAKPVSADILTV